MGYVPKSQREKQYGDPKWAREHRDWQEILVWPDIGNVIKSYQGEAGGDGIDFLFDNIAEIKRRVVQTNRTGVRYVPVTYKQGVNEWDIDWNARIYLMPKGYLLE